MKKYILFAIFILCISFVQAEQLPNVQVSLLEYEPSPAQPGQTIDLTIEVANAGPATQNAWVEIVDEYPFTVLETDDSKRAKSLGIVSGTQKLQYKIKIAQDVDDMTTRLTIRYGKESKEEYKEATFDIIIQTFDASVTINTVKQEPKSFIPGQEGELSLTITNNDDRPLNNIDILLDMTQSYDSASVMDNTLAMQSMINARLEQVNRRVASGLSPLTGVTPMMTPDKQNNPTQLTFEAIAPVGKTTLHRIKALNPGQTINVKFPVQATPQATPGIYAMPVYLNYNDEDNNPFHFRTEIAINIDMEPNTLITLAKSDLRSTDFASTIQILVANQGLSDLRYASIELLPSEDYTIITAPQEIYLGTLTSGQSANASFFVLPHKEHIEFKTALTYRDSFNTPHKEERVLPLAIINKNYYRDMPYEMMAAWAVLALILVGLTILYIKKK